MPHILASLALPEEKGRELSLFRTKEGHSNVNPGKNGEWVSLSLDVAGIENANRACL